MDFVKIDVAKLKLKEKYCAECASKLDVIDLLPIFSNLHQKFGNIYITNLKKPDQASYYCLTIANHMLQLLIKSPEQKHHYQYNPKENQLFKDNQLQDKGDLETFGFRIHKIIDALHSGHAIAFQGQ